MTIRTAWLHRLALAATLAFAAPAFAQDDEATGDDTGEDPGQPRLQLREPLGIQPRGGDPSLRLRPPTETAPEEALDEALDDVLDEPWPEDDTDGDFGQPLEGEDDYAEDEAYEDEIGEPIPLDEDTAELLDDEFGEPGMAAGGEEHEAHGPGSDHEEGEEHEEHEGAPEVIHIVAAFFNFFVWLAIVVWLGRKPISEYLKNRRLAVEEGLEEARRLSEEARAKHAEYSEKLDRLDEELEKLRGEMIQAGEAESDRIIMEAEQRAARMRKDATFMIEQQLKQLRSDLRREAIEAAVEAAEAVLTKEVSAADQQRLADGYLDELARSAKDDSPRDDSEVRA
ncbi:MAG: hypothetical protein AB7S26_02610 [Sandaracinaceae bacterium]